MNGKGLGLKFGLLSTLQWKQVFDLAKMKVKLKYLLVLIGPVSGLTIWFGGRSLLGDHSHPVVNALYKATLAKIAILEGTILTFGIAILLRLREVSCLLKSVARF